MSTPTTAKPKRSIPLHTKEIEYLKKVVESSPSLTAASISLGVSKDVLDRALNYKSTSEKTYRTLFPKSKKVVA